VQAAETIGVHGSCGRGERQRRSGPTGGHGQRELADPPLRSHIGDAATRPRPRPGQAAKRSPQSPPSCSWTSGRARVPSPSRSLTQVRSWRTRARHGRLRGQRRRGDALAAVVRCLAEAASHAEGHLHWKGDDAHGSTQLRDLEAGGSARGSRRPCSRPSSPPSSEGNARVGANSSMMLMNLVID
jgi:hypothetical protein